MPHRELQPRQLHLNNTKGHQEPSHSPGCALRPTWAGLASPSVSALRSRLSVSAGSSVCASNSSADSPSSGEAAEVRPSGRVSWGRWSAWAWAPGLSGNEISNSDPDHVASPEMQGGPPCDYPQQPRLRVESEVQHRNPLMQPAPNPPEELSSPPHAQEAVQKVTHHPAHENCCWSRRPLVLRLRWPRSSALWKVTGWGTRLCCCCPGGTFLTHPGSLQRESKPSSVLAKRPSHWKPGSLSPRPCS